jgi:hypothetical protein
MKVDIAVPKGADDVAGQIFDLVTVEFNETLTKSPDVKRLGRLLECGYGCEVGGDFSREGPVQKTCRYAEVLSQSQQRLQHPIGPERLGGEVRWQRIEQFVPSGDRLSRLV